MTIFREMLKFFRETPKKGRSKILAKISPPVSEVLDPLVTMSTSTADKLEVLPFCPGL